MINFFLKLILAKNIKRFINKVLKRDIKIIGNYNSWLEAKNVSSGYDHKIIFDKSKESFLKVINGIAKYERDSVLFYSDNVNYPLIKLLNSIQYKKKKTLNVLDFGGSFGSTYFQNLIFLKNQNKFNWFVVEQKHIVNYVKYFKLNKNLFFSYSIKNFLKKNIDIVIFSGVLQYLSNPFYHINILLKKKIKNFLILRTPFQTNKESIKVQVIPDHLYRATLPIRIFNENLFIKFFKKNNYSLKNNSFKNEMLDNIEFKNFLFKLKDK
jgi:putative methyltransferase (TIGR04325 family)